MNRHHLSVCLIVVAALPATSFAAERAAPRSTERAKPPHTGTAARTPTLPRRSTTVTPKATTPPQARTAQRSTGTVTPGRSGATRDWTYPRSSGSRGRNAVTPTTPDRTTIVTPRRGRDNNAARTWNHNGGLGITASPRHTGRENRSFIDLNSSGSDRGRRDWASRLSGVRAGTSGFNRHWDRDRRQQIAVGVRGRVRPYDYFRPTWRAYDHGWGERWEPWRRYWSWGGWRPYQWWHRPTWSIFTGWYGGGWGTYVPYDYGDTIVYQDNRVYQNGQPIATADEYAAQAMALADVTVPAPPVAPQATDPSTAAADWQPLGVFSLVTDEDADPNMFLQIAVSRDGYISGTYYNQLTNESLPIQGSVDKNTQRAAWRIGDNEQTVMEAGLYNLTQDQAPVLVHFGTDSVQNYLLVRMEQPADDSATGTTYQEWNE